MMFPLPGPTATVVTPASRAGQTGCSENQWRRWPQLRVDRPCHLIAVLTVGVNNAQMAVGLNEAWRYQLSRGVDDRVLRPRDDLFFNFAIFPFSTATSYFSL